MSDRRRGGSGRGAALRRAVGACGAVTTFLALGFCSPAAHADLDDLLEPIITAATTGVDQAGAAFSAFSPDDLLAGVPDFGSFADPSGQIDQLVANLSTQLDDQLRGLGADWPDKLLTGALGGADGQSLAELPGSAAATDSPETGGFLFGDSSADGGHTGAADATDTATAGTTPDPAGSGGEGASTGDSSTGSHADSAAGNNSGTNPSLPKMSMPSMPSSGGGGNGGGGNGGGSGNGNGRAKPTTANATAPLAGQ